MSHADPGQGHRDHVSLIRLLANPKAFHGSTLVTSGFLIVAQQLCALYVHEADAQYGLNENGIWVHPPDDDLIGRRIGYCRLAGEFRSVEHGSQRDWVAELNQVTLIRPLRPEFMAGTMSNDWIGSPDSYDQYERDRLEKQVDADNAAYRESFERARRLGLSFQRAWLATGRSASDKDLMGVAKELFQRDAVFQELWVKVKGEVPASGHVAWLRQWTRT